MATKKSAKKEVNKQLKSLKKGFNSLKGQFLDKTKGLRSKFNNMVKELKTPKKKSKKLTKAQQKALKEDRKNAILGIGLLLVVVSIAYSTSVILIGVDSDTSKVALAPQAIFAFITLLKAFSKLYK